MSRIAPSERESVEATPRKAMTVGRRGRIIARQDHECARCHERVSVFEIDHILPIELGGVEDDDNLQALCGRCHRAKTNADMARIRKAARLRRQSDPSTRRRSPRPLKGRGFDRDPLR